MHKKPWMNMESALLVLNTRIIKFTEIQIQISRLIREQKSCYYLEIE